ncbi:MAG: adenylate/guanylate cyclase domain-containing protein [Anaerolineae bacterium]
MSNIRVLVVDDSREMREFVVRYVLEPNGFEAVEAMNGAEGMRKALQGGIDLMLLDLEMPRMNGFEVLDGLRARCCEVPVILMTSHGSEAIAVEVFRKGVRDYVIKPFTADEMLMTIERALKEVRLQREKEALTVRLMQSKQQLEQRLRELHTLSQIGRAVTALMERDKLLERVVDAALYITDSEEGAILLEDEDVGTLREYVRKRRVKGQERQVSRRTEDQVASDAVRKGDAIRTGAMLYAPLKIGEKSIGALGVSNKVTARFFTEHDKRLLIALGNYAAIAIENARLLQQVEEAKEREKQQIRGVLERYVAPSVVEKLIARPDGVTLGGVRQKVTILFADIRGFSSFGARVTPEVLVNVLNHHIAVVVEAILAERGTLDKFLGDAVMAYFNAPLPQPDHALRAVRAAWRMCQAVKESHPQLPSAYQLQFGVGVSTGEVLVGNIGAPQLMSYTVIGDAVNVCRRLQEHARGGQILICQQVYRLVQKYVEARPVGTVEIKGHPQPTPAFEVVAVHV